ncbi:DNA-binding transcriptional regulator [Escherichia coli]|nr:DNA-binding transcriptional regulator [Escherichia coli]
MMSLWDALRMNMMISYQELVRTFPELEAVLMGAGIGYLLYEQIKEYLDTGRLECVLEDWSTERPGFQIYYPNRQYMSCGLRAFLDYVKTGQICQSQRHRPQ